MSLSGKASTHLENKSVITRIYLLSCEDVGKGPIMSHDNLSKRQDAVIVPRGATGFGTLLTLFTLFYPLHSILFISWPVIYSLESFQCLFCSKMAYVIVYLLKDHMLQSTRQNYLSALYESIS